MARLIAPVVTQVPIQWLYPTGRSQESSHKSWRSRYFDWADVIAGDFHYIRRYLPEQMPGKIVLTNTTTADDVELLRKRGVKMLVTTTPRFDGRSLPTNLLEASFVAVTGKHPLSSGAYRELLAKSGLEPDIQQLQ
ncbi:MAG: hypothetical protein JSV66_05175 [Trueperaceae bacterium]|nr:MAG: hypothetical protein JSV66_05175 [Trueperaceae bacterium]